jgi:hypothetical protein
LRDPGTDQTLDWKLDPQTRLKNLCLLVSTFDAYSACWKPFLHGLKKYWPGHPNLYFLTNFKDVEGCQTIKVGADKGWSGNLLYALGQIDTPYVLYAQEDYWLKRPVVAENILAYLALMEKDLADYIRLYPAPPPDLPFPGDERLGIIAPDAAYRASCQLALWRKTILMELLDPHESGWTFEVEGSRRSCRYGDRFLSVNARRHGVDYVFTAVVSGEWIPEAYEYARAEGISVDFGALPKKPLLKYCKDHVRGFLYGRKQHLKRMLKRLVVSNRG